MTTLRSSGCAAFRFRNFGPSTAATAFSIAVAYAAATAIFPFLADLNGEDVRSAVAVTVLIAALPLAILLTWSVARIFNLQQEAAAREELFVAAQQIGKFGYWHYDVAQQLFTMSDNVHDLLGDPDRRLRMSADQLLEMTNLEDRQKLAEALHRIVVDGACEEIEYRITGLDGVEKTFWVDGRRLVDKSGNPVKAYGASQDVTERKRMEAALRESEDHYRHAVELNPQIPWTADPRGNLLEISPSWSELMGMEPEEVLGAGWAAAVHPADLDRTLQNWRAATSTGQPLDQEHRLRLADGSYQWFRARAAARRGDGGEIIRWYGTLEDVHDRRLVSVALQDSEAFARSILESTPDCIGVLNLDGSVQFMNGPGLRNLEISDFEGRVKGRSCVSLWPAIARAKVKGAVEKARAGHTARFSDFRPTAKGTPRWWDVSVSPILGADGKPDRLLAILRDMTAAKRAQDKVEQAGRLAEQTAQQLENVLSSTTDCVMTLDRGFRITYLNKRAQELVARGRDLVGLHHDEAFPELVSSTHKRRLEDIFSRQVPAQFEEFLVPYNAWVYVHAYPSEDSLNLFFTDVSDRRLAQEQLLYLAHHDALTGLLNRTVLHERLAKSLAAASAKKQIALLFLDLDEFKSVNDSLGHSAGDHLLVQVSERLKKAIRGTDVAARFGGDEFAVVAEVNTAQEAAALAARIIGSLNRRYDLDGRSVSVGVSIGVAVISHAGVAADHALRDADIALYRAKGEGRGIYRIFETSMAEELQDRGLLKQDLQDALARDEFSIVYQPLVDLKSNRVNGFEALVRWKHPVRGVVPPATFIPIAEECGLIDEIGEWVLAKACREATNWPEDISVAVNLSPVQFRTNNLVQTVSRCLSESGLKRERLQLEITESVLLTDSVANLEVLHELRELGIAISMDDFGTGYSSLSYLRSFPFDKIKIDRDFVSDLSESHSSSGPSAIVLAIIELARGLGISTIAEGVETPEQLAALRAMGCSEVQGFLFSKPVPGTEVPGTISRLNRIVDDAAPFLRVVS